MHVKRRRELMLAVAALLLVAVAAWRTQRSAAPPAAAVAPSATTTRANAQPPANPIADVDLGALKAERPAPGESTRNPFRFKPRAAAPPSAATIKEQQAAAAAAAQAGSGPAEPPPVAKIPLKYIGDMADPKDPAKRIAILSDTRSTYYGREGEVLEGRYRIVRIGVESIELTYLDGRGRQTIRQTGQ